MTAYLPQLEKDPPPKTEKKERKTDKGCPSA